MKYVKTFVCFANSRKTRGRCIAGKEWQGGKPGEWVRPVSSRPTHEVSEEERRYESGQDPELLDIINVPCEYPCPASHQRENHVIDARFFWEKHARLNWKEIHSWLDNPSTLWGLGDGSYAGLHNRVAVGQEDAASLYLVGADDLRLLVGPKRLLVGPKAPPYPDSKRAVRAEFHYRGETYRMDVTDPVIERNWLARPDGQYELPRSLLCVSLGDPYAGYYYKLVAGVLYRERFA